MNRPGAMVLMGRLVLTAEGPHTPGWEMHGEEEVNPPSAVRVVTMCQGPIRGPRRMRKFGPRTIVGPGS